MAEKTVFVKLSFKANPNFKTKEFEIPCSTFAESITQKFLVPIDQAFLANVVFPLLFKLKGFSRSMLMR